MTPEEYIKAYTRGCSNELVHGGYHEWLTPENALAAVELAREEMKASIKCKKKSPITGGEMRLLQEKSSVKFRGEEITFVKKFYHCVDSGQEFTDTELDNDNMWAIFRAYWERKGFEHFYDIDGYREEQEPASDDLEREMDRYFETMQVLEHENIFEDTFQRIAKHFVEWQKEKDEKNIGDRLWDAYLEGEKETKEQMMKDAIEATVCGVGSKEKDCIIGGEFYTSASIPPFNIGDKVKVIIEKDND